MAGGRDPGTRRELGATATEADRDRALVQLRAAHEGGRLSHEEFERRVATAMSARTRMQVLATHAGYTARELPRRGGRVAGRVNRAALGAHAVAYTGANGAAIGVWALAGEGLFWPALVLVPTTGLLAAHAAAAPLLRHAWRSLRS